LSVRAAAVPVSAALLLLVAGCGGEDAPSNGQAGAGQPDTVGLPQPVEQQPGVTPMAQRVAVIGFLNKRNGIVRDLVLRPGQAVRIRDAVVRLRACETTAPWETQQLTGAFLQLDVQRPDDRWQRVFSGWVYKESPSLNVVEHPVYDVWPKSCTMTYPAAPGSSAAPQESSSRSSAPRSGGAAAARPEPARSAPAEPAEETPPTPAPATPPPAAPEEEPPPPSAADSNAT
jgi:hypothetical protein